MHTDQLEFDRSGVLNHVKNLPKRPKAWKNSKNVDGMVVSKFSIDVMSFLLGENATQG